MNKLISSKKYRNRKPIPAVLLSFITPGLGQMYNGRFQKGLVFSLIKLIPALIIPVLIHSSESRSFITTVFSILIFTAFITLSSAIDAFIEALRMKKTEHKSYNRLSLYILFFFASTILSAASGFIFFSVFNFYNVENSSVTLSAGDTILIKKYNPHNYKRGDLIIYKDKDLLKTSRIMAMPGDNIFFTNRTVSLNGAILERGIFDENEMKALNLKNNTISETNDNFRYPIIINDNPLKKQKKDFQLDEESFIVAKDDRTIKTPFLTIKKRAVLGRIEGTIFSRNIHRIITKTGIMVR